MRLYVKNYFVKLSGSMKLLIIYSFKNIVNILRI